MTQFSIANFTGTSVAFNVYTPDTGGAFTRNQGTNIPYIGQQTSPDIRDMLTPSGTGSQQSYWTQGTVAAATADYDVVALLKYNAPGVTGQNFGIGGRGNSGQGTGYYFGWDEAAQVWRLGKLATWAGGLTSISSSADTLVDGQTYYIKLEMRSTAIKCYVNGAAVISVTDSSFTTGTRAAVIDLGTGHQSVPGAASGISGLSMDFFTSFDPVTPPANTVAPVASGTGTVGQTLSVTDGTWTGSPTFTYQWKRGGVAIGGATNNSYLLAALDAGTTVSCTVSGSNLGNLGGPAVTADSNGISVAAESTDVTPTFTSGLPRSGQALVLSTATGASQRGGFNRTSGGGLAATTTTTGMTMQGGFMRRPLTGTLPWGPLVYEVNGTVAYVQNGFARTSNGALAVTTSTSNITKSQGLWRDSSKRLVVAINTSS